MQSSGWGLRQHSQSHMSGMGLGGSGGAMGSGTAQGTSGPAMQLRVREMKA